MNRIDRLTAILIQLQSRRVVKAQDIAERFSISLRTVYRDIRTLEESGIPINGEAGVGYSIMDGYRLPPVMFTKEEATAFLTAEKLIEKLTDTSTDLSYKSAMYKIRAVLRTTEKDYIEHIDKHIEVLNNPYIPKQEAPTGPIQAILKSIGDKAAISINYFANHNQQMSKRTIEPVGIFFMTSHWHLIAYCHLRNDYRNFRVDRIFGIEQTSETFKKEHPPLKEYLSQISKEKDLYTVIMQINKEVVRYIGDQKYYNGFVSEREVGNKIEMTFLTASLEGFARWYIMFGDQADILGSPNLKTRIKEIIELVSKKVK